MKKQFKVAVGMSGGVDSTMAALILKDKGYEVIGLTMRIWQGDSSSEKNVRGGCYGPGEESDAKATSKICERLGIAHHVIDLSDEYRSGVLENFSKEYLDGRTPNPCVLCNPLIKFGALLEKALELGIRFDYFATGHYARVVHDDFINRYLLKKASDLTKDQSYFLYRLSQSQLEKTMFPLGEFSKGKIKEFARKAGFTDIAEKPESQDFVDGGIYESLFPVSKRKNGEILDLDGNVLGFHNGIVNFTIGQRKGIRIGGMKEPLYVLRIDPYQNQIVVGPRQMLAVDELTAVNLNWIAFERMDAELKAKARLRSHQQEFDCLIFPLKENTIQVRFTDPQYSATPGQSIVFYQGDVVVGGGIIQSTHLANLLTRS